MENEAAHKHGLTFLDAIVSLGDSPDDTEEQLTAHHFLILMGLLMSVGGLIWGSISFAYGLKGPSLIPYGYTVLTAVNFAYFHVSKNFKRCRFVQVLLSLLLPFLFQWGLGGFAPSGAVMLWSLIALAGSLTFQDARLGRNWLVAFLALTIVSGLLDNRLEGIAVPQHIQSLFFVLNISVIATIVFVLNVYLLAKRDEATAKLSEMSSVLKQMFGRYLSAQVMNSLLENPSELELGGKRRAVTIMMTDLRGFTALSERLEPEQVVKMLNTYFEVMVETVLGYGGTINEFIGDSMLVIFGAPNDMKDRAQRAIACAIEMQNSMNEVNERNTGQGLPELDMGIGLNEAEVVVGNIGSSKRSKYAVVGSGVNVASRIESYTTGGQILASQSVIDQVEENVRVDSQRTVVPKGAETGLRLFEVGGISGPFNLALKGKPHITVTLRSQIPLAYTLVEEKQLGGRSGECEILRLSKHGAEVAGAGQLTLFSDLQLRLKEVEERLSERGFYGKVTRKLPDRDGTYWLSFTSVPPEIAAYLYACRQYGSAAGGNALG